MQEAGKLSQEENRAFGKSKRPSNFRELSNLTLKAGDGVGVGLSR